MEMSKIKKILEGSVNVRADIATYVAEIDNIDELNEALNDSLEKGQAIFNAFNVGMKRRKKQGKNCYNYFEKTFGSRLG